MSGTEIINGSTELNEAERRAGRQRLVELAVHNEDFELSDPAATEGAMSLDRKEEEARC